MRLFRIRILQLCQSEKDSEGGFSNHLKGAYKEAGEGCFVRSWNGRTRSKGHRLKEEKFRLDVCKKIFTVMGVRYWNRLPRATVAAPALTVLKARWDRVWSNLR